jgi:putative tRNA adenosine deaminase-associated protein
MTRTTHRSIPVTQRAHAISGQVGRWSAHELDLTDIDDLDSLLDELRDLGGPIVVAFVEEDDEYVGIVRLDSRADDDARVFLSDQRALFDSPLAERLFSAALPPVTRWDVDDEDAARTAPAPSGDPALLSDLGTSADELIDLAGEDGMLPADLINALAERAGCADILDDVRG